MASARTSSSVSLAPRLLGARLVHGDQLLTWDERAVTLWSLPELTVRHVFSLGDGPRLLRELASGLVAVVYGSYAERYTLAVLDLERCESHQLWQGTSAINYLVVEGDMVVTEVGCWSSTGELRCRLPPRDACDADVVALGDGTVIRPGERASPRLRVATGEVVETLGPARAVHALGDGGFLLATGDHLHLHGGRAPLTLAVNDAWCCRVHRLGSERLLIASFEIFFLASLTDGTLHRVDSGHACSRVALLRVSDGLWASHDGWVMPRDRKPTDTIEVWSSDPWERVASHEVGQAIRCVVVLPRQRLARLVESGPKAREVTILDARTGRVATTVKAPRNLVGLLALPDARLLAWSRDGSAYVLSLP